MQQIECQESKFSCDYIHMYTNVYIFTHSYIESPESKFRYISSFPFGLWVCVFETTLQQFKAESVN